MNEEQTKNQIKLNKIIESLQKYNLAINEEGMLIKMIQKPKTFQEFNDTYPQILRLITKYIKVQLFLKYNMTKYKILLPNKEYIYCSNNLVIPNLIIQTKLLIILNDPNNPLGVFSKPKLIFENIPSGSVFPVLDLAINKNYSVIIPYIYKKDKIDYNIDAILGNFWKVFIQIRLKYISEIIIISQKTASINLIKLLEKYPSDFIEKTKKIILINSKHFDMHQILDKDIKELFRQKATNFTLATDPVGTQLYSSIISPW